MRIGLIADTHIPEAGEELPPEVYEVFNGVDLVVHAGDIHDLVVLDWLEARIAPVRGARGNGEDGSGGRPIRPQDPRIPRADVFEVDGITIGVTHALALPEHPPIRTIETMMQFEFGRAVDIVIHGDTHVEGIELIRGTLTVNPGSPTLPHNLNPMLGTVGLLDIDEQGVTARIVPLWDPHWNDYASGVIPTPPTLDPRMWRHSGPWYGRWTRPRRG